MTKKRFTSFKLDQITWEINGKLEEKDKLARSVRMLGVCQPIILHEEPDGSLKILAGNRRCLAFKMARAFYADDGGPMPTGLNKLDAVVYSEMPEIEQKAISIAENEARTDNPVQTWRRIQEAKKMGCYDDIVALSTLDRTQLAKIDKLNRIRPKLIDAHESGKIALGNLLNTASLGGARQDYLLTLLKTKPKITGEDIKEAKTARAAAVLANMPSLPNTPLPVQPIRKTYFIVLDDKALAELPTDLQAALEKKVNGAKLFRLIEI